MAVEFDHSDDAMAFVGRAVEAVDAPLATVRKEVLFGQHPRYLEAPRVAVALDRNEKQAVMEHCHQHRRSLAAVVTESVRSLATDPTDVQYRRLSVTSSDLPLTTSRILSLISLKSPWPRSFSVSGSVRARPVAKVGTSTGSPFRTASATSSTISVDASLIEVCEWVAP